MMEFFQVIDYGNPLDSGQYKAVRSCRDCRLSNHASKTCMGGWQKVMERAAIYAQNVDGLNDNGPHLCPKVDWK